MQSGKFLRLADDCSLRSLEKPYVYNRRTDELYELDSDLFGFLKRCDGTASLEAIGNKGVFLDYCLAEGILELTDTLCKRDIRAGEHGGLLRYLELQATGRCNLRCRHCYLSAGDGRDLETGEVFAVLDDFDSMQGLRLLFSGGEPLMHGGFREINERLPEYGFRSVLLTNGTLITKEVAGRLKFHEAQVSMDGLWSAHDFVRGEGSFRRALAGINRLQDAGIPVSIATMVTAINRDSFGRMAQFVRALGAVEWNIDVPVPVGRSIKNRGLFLPPQEAARYLEYGYGGGYHAGPNGYACGAHLCAVGSNGNVAKCGFYLDRPAGSISEGLKACWEKMPQQPLSKLECDCEHLESCKGGCRFRAEHLTSALGPDPVRCCANGVKLKEVKP